MVRKDDQFQLFYDAVKKAANSIKGIAQPAMPRKRKRPNYSIIQRVVGYERPASNAHYPETTGKYFKQMYFEALEGVVNAMEDHFE